MATQKLTQQLVNDIVSEAVGEDSLAIIEFLKDKKNISDFKIAEKVDLDIHEVRNILYRLYNQNLVTYFRKKDREKGWYISYWTFNQKGVPELALAIKRNKLQMLKERLRNEERHKGLFYICPKFCTRMHFEQATEAEFKCPECGQALKHQDNEKTIERIKENIIELEQ